MPQERSVFISYSHDSDTHAAFVLELANRLRADGLDCWLDRYENGAPAQGWQRWMEQRIEQADAVLIVCTENYLQRYRGQAGQGGFGVNFEALVISQTLYDRYYRNDKFIPVIPDDGSLANVPLPLKGYNTYRLPTDYTALYRVLSAQPATPPPALGEARELPPEPLPEPGMPAARAATAASTAGTTRPRQSGMSDTVRAAWIGAGALLLAAVVGAIVTQWSSGDITTHGDCSGVITGDINAAVGCSKTTPASGGQQ